MANKIAYWECPLCSRHYPYACWAEACRDECAKRPENEGRQNSEIWGVLEGKNDKAAVRIIN